MKNFRLDFVGIGAPKCATTWLTKCLAEHPQVFLPEGNEINELNYFSRNYTDQKSEYERYGLKRYMKFFKKCDFKNKVVGEMSTRYLYEKRVAKIIKKHFPNVKILVSLRNPVERAYSKYLVEKNFILTEKEDSFEKAFYKRESYKKEGLYYKYLKYYFDLFPQKNIKIILVDDIKKNPKKTVQEVYKFLGVNENFIPPTVNKKVNEAARTKNILLRKTINFFSEKTYQLEKIGFGSFRFFLKRKLKMSHLVPLINKMNSEPVQKPKLKEDIRCQIKKEFREDIEKLEKLIGRKLDQWK